MNQIRRNLFRAGVAAGTWTATQGFSTSAQRVDQQNAQGQQAQGQRGQGQQSGSQNPNQNAASGCFRRGTNILTPKGVRPIEHLPRGDLLQTIFGLACIEETVSKAPRLTHYGYRSCHREMQGYLLSAWAPIYDMHSSLIGDATGSTRDDQRQASPTTAPGCPAIFAAAGTERQRRANHLPAPTVAPKRAPTGNAGMLTLERFP